MKAPTPNPVVHLELHTRDLERASAFYTGLCGWESDEIRFGSRSYVALELGGDLGGGMVECRTERSLWLPYVEVENIVEATELAQRLGATVLLAPREGPTGWRSVVRSPAAGEVAFWQPKR